MGTVAASTLGLCEGRRERETLKYLDPTLKAGTIRIPDSGIIPRSQLKTSADPALTAYAELATLRLGASRALISLFDSQFQHVIAEATPFSSLKPSVPSEHGAADGRELWLCGASLPRTLSICERALLEPQVESPNKSSDKRSSQIPPIYVIKDLATEPDSSPKLFVLGSTGDHFYAGVPIRTARGINIGVLCIFDRHPRRHFDSSCKELLRDLSATIMTHLETRRLRESHRRADRMVRGIGSFVEGSTTTSGWQGGPSMNSFVNIPDVEGSLNANQQRFSQSAGVTVREGIIAPRPEPPDIPPESPSYFRPKPLQHNAASSPVQSPISPEGPMHPIHHDDEVKHVFSKAANIVRESIETEGVLFLNASVSSFGRGVGNGTEETTSHSSSSSLSGEEGKGSASNATPADWPCRILGFSTSLNSSIDGDADHNTHSSFSENFLQRLIRHHPKGAIFNFGEDGSLQLSDLSSDEAVLVNSSVDSPSVEDSETTHQWTQGVHRRRRQSESRRQTEAIITMFPGARSVAFFPAWDPQRQRWFAGGFAYTKAGGRTFTVEGELSYLTAFGAVVMTQVLRTRAKMAERSKSDVLDSLSHEFRSPLHGIILGAELLRDTSLDALQGDMLHTIETCSRTLLDTIDHLLDWSRINKFRTTSGAVRRSTKKETSIEAGMMSIVSDINLDALTEEVVEAVYVGHCFQQIAADRQSKAQSSGRPIENALQWLDSAQAVEQSTTGRDNQYQTLEDVTVSLDITSGIPWAFRAQPGALRRIIMNLVGNSFKYTTQGFVTVTLDRDPDAEPVNKRHCNVRLTVADSGCGMSDDYLKNDVFTPFAQGHTLTPGTGLGLPLVKRIVRTLGGTITMESNIGEGTRVVVKVPIELAPSSVSTPTTPPHTNVSEFRELVDNLKGLRVQLLGFPKRSSQVDVFGTNLDEHDSMTRICRDWLLMEIVDAAETNTLRPDLVLYDPRYFAEYVENQHNNEMVPAVVICRSALAARQLATNYSQVLPEQTDRQLEFISQPVGPRKLARVLSLVFLRWMALQTSTAASPALLMASTERLRPLGGSQGSHIRLSAANSSDSGISGPGALQRRVGSSVSSIGDLRPRLLQSPLPNVVGNGGSNRSIHSLEIAEDDPTFLLVEDNLINMRMLMAFMKKLGLPYETATDGQQAVEKFRERPGRFGCVLMDISMPVMDGLQATRHIRAIEAEGKLIRCAILALTGLASDDAQQEAFASGVDLFLTKPVKLVELSQILTSRGLGTSLPPP
ncbi:Hsp90 [Fusarium albosuccineum]|uniref:histidine kinase n=1 Tax=Fusarium albosuccineum TaxID=1237068 RepID=A0A8H4P9K7_9HYPO|nr:Hsp90 [Fusarium albosuccineum]